MSKKTKKKGSKLLALLLTVCMIFTMMPAMAWAADNVTDTENVYVTVVKDGAFVKSNIKSDTGVSEMAYVPVKVGSDSLTIDGVFNALHNQYYNGSDGYTGGSSITKFWGVESGNNGYFKNDTMLEKLSDSVNANDHVVFWFYQGSWATGNLDSYTFFDNTTVSAAGGDEVSLTLKYYDDNFGTITSPLADASITVNGEVATGKVTDANGNVKLYFAEAGTYLVSAKAPGTSYIVPPVCVVTVDTADSGAESTLNDDMAALTLVERTNEDIDLPILGQSGKSSITWATSDAGVISATGEVTRALEEKTATLTATIKYGSQTVTKAFTITVPAVSANDLLEEVKEVLTAEALTPVQYENPGDSMSGVQYYKYNSPLKDINIVTKAQALAETALEDVNVSLKNAVTDVIAEDGTITYPSDEAAAVTVPFVLGYNDTTVEHKVELIVPKQALTKEAQISEMKKTVTEAMTNEKILNGNTSIDAIKTAMNLPGGKTSGLYITWTSNNEEVLKVAAGNPTSNNQYPTGGYYTTTVVRPDVGESDAKVTLTATFTYKETSTLCGAGAMPENNTMTIDVTVPAVTDTELTKIKDAAGDAIEIGKSGGGVADLTAVKEDLYFPSTVGGYKTTWSAENTAISIPTSGSGKATVTRPTDGTDQKVNITATIQIGSTPQTVTIEATVKAWSQSELDAERTDLQKVADALTFDEIKNKNTTADAVTTNLNLRQGAKFESNGTVSFSNYSTSSSNKYAITWSIEPSGVITFSNGTGKVTAGTQDTTVNLTASVNLKNPISVIDAVSKTITVTVPVAHTPNTAESLKPLLANIAASYTENIGEWVIMDMGQYAKLGINSTATSTTAKQTYINNAIESITADSVGETTYSKAILALAAQGIDPGKLYPVNSNTPIDAVSALAALDNSSSAWSANYTLASFQLGDNTLSTEEEKLLNAVLAAQTADGSWSEYGTIDTTANVLSGLAFYAGDDGKVDEAIAKGINYLAAQLSDSGTYSDDYSGSNANSTAMVIIGLCANGINPDTDSRFIKNGKSVLDGLLSFAMSDNSGFGYTDNSTLNGGATEQAFRALIAAYNVMSGGNAFNIYDFSANTLAPGRATGSGQVQTPENPPNTNDDITVTLTVKADTGYWLQDREVTVKTGSTVYHALIKGLEGSGISQVGASSGYVRSMTKDGKTLAEFDKGANSGWLYKVSGALPDVGLTEYPISDGDVIVWYYTDDWTKDPSASAVGGESSTEITVPISGDANTIHVSASVQGDKATIDEVDLKKLDTVIGDDTQTGTVTIDFSTLDQELTEVEIPADVVKQISAAVNDPNNDAHSLEIVFSDGTSIEFDAVALGEKAAQAEGEDITISILPAAKAKPNDKQKEAIGGRPFYDISVTSGGKHISDMGGHISLHAPYELQPGENAKGVTVWYVDDDGNKEKCETTYDRVKKRVNWKTDHLSVYMIGYDADAAGVTELSKAEVKDLLAKLTPVARASKAKKKNIKVKVKLDKKDKAIVKQLKAAGYTVKYNFYRSTKKTAKYSSKKIKKTTAYTDTRGRKGSRYYYKARVQVYNAEGKLIARTSLKQCKPASKKWTK